MIKKVASSVIESAFRNESGCGSVVVPACFRLGLDILLKRCDGEDEVNEQEVKSKDDMTGRVLDCYV